MRFTILTTALVSAVMAFPASQSNVLAPVQDIPITAPVVDFAEPFAIAAIEKREASLTKRATLIVDVYLDLDGTGRHEGLFTDSASFLPIPLMTVCG